MDATTHLAFESRTPTEVNSLSFSMPSVEALRLGGYNRAGAIPVIMDSSMRLLFQRHNGNEKIAHGTWGPLAETSHAALIDGAWQIEDPIATVLRGIREEHAVDAKVTDFDGFDTRQDFRMNWPVGVNHLGENAYAVCPLLVASAGLCARIMEAPQTTEVSERMFIDIDEAFAITNYRPGVPLWLHNVIEAMRANPGLATRQIMQPPELGVPLHQQRNAVLSDLSDVG